MDLHVHTTASDGADSPEEVVFAARKIGLSAIAITDHDTFAGVDPATAAGDTCGLLVIPGIELSAEYQQSEVHILGYLPDMTDKEFKEKLSLFQTYRLQRIQRMVAKLQEMGATLTMERVLEIAGGGAAGRPHLAAAMVENGMVDHIGQAFRDFIGKDCPAYIPRYKITPHEAIKLIRQAKGIPVLAHPGLSQAGPLVPELVDEGLLGIEAFHPAHSPEMAHYYQRIGRQHNLIITGGSDYHGLERKKGHHLGMLSVPDRVLDEMVARKEEETPR